VSSSGVDAAGCLPPPPVDVAADAASRRQHEPAAATRLVRVASASTPKVQIRGENIVAATRTARTLREAGYGGPLTLLLEPDEWEDVA
jgi:hypothetical protein